MPVKATPLFTAHLAVLPSRHGVSAEHGLIPLSSLGRSELQGSPLVMVMSSCRHVCSVVEHPLDLLDVALVGRHYDAASPGSCT